MTDTIYWAVKLNDISKIKLLSSFPPIHPNVYAEHMTIAFRPSDETEQGLDKFLGKHVEIKVIGYVEDEYGQAVAVESDVPRIDNGSAHVTISCANGTGPVYSGKLLNKKEWAAVGGISLHGVVAKFTKSGWQF